MPGQAGTGKDNRPRGAARPIVFAAEWEAMAGQSPWARWLFESFFGGSGGHSGRFSTIRRARSARSLWVCHFQARPINILLPVTDVDVHIGETIDRRRVFDSAGKIGQGGISRLAHAQAVEAGTDVDRVRCSD